MTLNWVRTVGDEAVAPWPSRAAITSYASSYLPFRINRRGESGKKGQRAYMQSVKTGIWSVLIDTSILEHGQWLTDLEGKWESPLYTAGSKGESKSEPG